MANASSAGPPGDDRYRTLVEWSPAPLVVHRHGRVLYANPAALRLFGAPDGQTMVQMPMLDRVHPDHHAVVRARVQGLTDGTVKATDKAELKFLRLDGTVIDVETHATVIEYEGEQAVQVSIRDITAHKQAEAQLRQSEARFRSLVTNAPYCIHEIDLDGRLISMNAAGLTMMGVDAERAIQGLVYLNTVCDADRARIAELLAGALAGEPAAFVFRGCSGMDFQSTFVPITDDAGKVRRLMGVTIDITAQKHDEAVDAFLAQAGMSADGEPFFPALARFLAESLRMDYVCIDRLVGDSLNATTLAVWYDGHFEDNLTYALKETPCGEVVGNRVCCFPSGVSTLFPNDAALQELRAESYVGVTLYGHAGQPIGLIAVIGREPLHNRARAESTLARVALRAAGELERLMVADELRASEAHARAVIDASPAPLALNDETGRITYLNPAFVRTFGYTRDDIATVADWWPKAYPDPAYRAQVIQEWSDELERSIRTATPFVPREIRIRCKDGSDRFAVVHATMLSPAVAQQLLVVFHDVTDRRLVEAARRLEGAALQAVANAVVITDRAGVIVWTNNAFTTSTGYAPHEAIGRMPGELLKSGEHDTAFYRELWETISAGNAWRGEMVNRRKNGSRYVQEMTISPLRDESGEVTHFIAVKQDITQRRALESQLQQAQRLESVGLLAGGVAHDFNNMLGVILGNVEIAIEQVTPGEPLHEDLQEIRKAAVRSADLTRQLLAFARQQTIAPAVLDLNETVPSMLAMLNRLIGEDVRLVFKPSPTLWPVLMDPSQMDQILTNLVVNARHAIADVGVVTIATADAVLDAAFCERHADATPGEYVRLSVHDTGSGMDAATQARIFEPFFSTKGVGSGTGLGLATVYGAVKQNHGFVTVSSTVGEGTIFEVYLPRHQGALRKTPNVSQATSDLRGGETILLVEDEPAVRRLVTKALAGQGYVVLSAGSATEALRVAASHSGAIDLLVSDVVMPGMNGRDLAAALRETRSTLTPLFMSGHTADVITTRGLLAPGVAFIEKPFTPVAMAAKARAVLDGVRR